MIAVFTPSCEALLQALEDTNTTQVDDEKNTDANQNSKGKTQGDNSSNNGGDSGNTSTSKGKK